MHKANRIRNSTAVLASVLCRGAHMPLSLPSPLAGNCAPSPRDRSRGSCLAGAPSRPGASRGNRHAPASPTLQAGTTTNCWCCFPGGSLHPPHPANAPPQDTWSLLGSWADRSYRRSRLQHRWSARQGRCAPPHGRSWGPLEPRVAQGCSCTDAPLPRCQHATEQSTSSLGDAWWKYKRRSWVHHCCDLGR